MLQLDFFSQRIAKFLQSDFWSAYWKKEVSLHGKFVPVLASNEPHCEKTCFMPYVNTNNKCVVQPDHRLYCSLLRLKLLYTKSQVSEQLVRLSKLVWVLPRCTHFWCGSNYSFEKNVDNQFYLRLVHKSYLQNPKNSDTGKIEFIILKFEQMANSEDPD